LGRSFDVDTTLTTILTEPQVPGTIGSHPQVITHGFSGQGTAPVSVVHAWHVDGNPMTPAKKQQTGCCYAVLSGVESVEWLQ
jgi:hypothetical protein